MTKQNDGKDDVKLSNKDPIEGTVKWFDSVKGFGFVVPSDGSPDIMIHYSVLREVDRRSIPEGASLTFETEEGEKGAHVSKILSIDLSDTLGFDQGAIKKLLDDGIQVSEDFVPAVVKWFNRKNGYGFVSGEDGEQDIFLHMRVIYDAGMSHVDEGQSLMVRIAEGKRGPMVAQIAPSEDD